MSGFEPVQLSYTLSRRQRLVAHVGMWLHYWPGLLLLLTIVAVVVALAVLKSAWFLLILLVGLPPINNLHNLLAGFLQPLLLGPQQVEVTLEESRIGFRFGSGSDKEPTWLPLEEIVHVERFGDVHTLLGAGGIAINIPVTLVDARYLEHVRASRGPTGC